MDFSQSDVIFKQISPGSTDRQSYKELHNLLFKGASITDDWIDWYHRDISSVEAWAMGTRTWAAFDNEKLIGIWSVEPKILPTENDCIRVGRCFAVGIHPEYRRRNLFVSLSKFAIEEERKIGEYEYILGFPQQGKAVVGGHLKSGWDPITKIDMYSRSNQIEVQYQPKSVMNLITYFSDCETELGFVEDADYLNLRWIYHPDHQYICYEYNDAFIVLKPYGKVCHIVNMFGSSDNVSILLNGVAALSIKHGWEEVNVWCSDTGKYKDALVSAGFSKFSDYGLPIQLIAVKINANIPLVIENYNFQMGVEEGY